MSDKNDTKYPRNYGILHYQCGNGWQLKTNLTLDEAIKLKEGYIETTTQVKVIKILE